MKRQCTRFLKTCVVLSWNPSMCAFEDNWFMPFIGVLLEDSQFCLQSWLGRLEKHRKSKSTESSTCMFFYLTQWYIECTNSVHVYISIVIISHAHWSCIRKSQIFIYIYIYYLDSRMVWLLFVCLAECWVRTVWCRGAVRWYGGAGQWYDAWYGGAVQWYDAWCNGAVLSSMYCRSCRFS